MRKQVVSYSGVDLVQVGQTLIYYDPFLDEDQAEVRVLEWMDDIQRFRVEVTKPISKDTPFVPGEKLGIEPTFLRFLAS